MDETEDGDAETDTVTTMSVLESIAEAGENDEDRLEREEQAAMAK